MKQQGHKRSKTNRGTCYDTTGTCYKDIRSMFERQQEYVGKFPSERGVQRERREVILREMKSTRCCKRGQFHM
jgi:hypothetical protein